MTDDIVHQGNFVERAGISHLSYIGSRIASINLLRRGQLDLFAALHRPMPLKLQPPDSNLAVRNEVSCDQGLFPDFEVLTHVFDAPPVGFFSLGTVNGCLVERVDVMRCSRLRHFDAFWQPDRNTFCRQ